MFKVICIDDEWDGEAPHIRFNDIVTVEEVSKDDEGEWYCFSEYPEWEYETSAFRPLSNIDENELVNEKELAS